MKKLVIIALGLALLASCAPPMHGQPPQPPPPGAMPAPPPSPPPPPPHP